MTNLEFIKNLKLSDFTEEAKAVADEISEQIFNDSVPTMGIADTVAGEVASAMNTIIYRYFNDGEKLLYCDYDDSVYVEEHCARIDGKFNYIEHILTCYSDIPGIKEAKEILRDIKYNLNREDKEYEFLMFKLQLLVNEITKEDSPLVDIENYDNGWDFAEESDEDYYKKIGLRP